MNMANTNLWQGKIPDEPGIPFSAISMKDPTNSE